MLRLALNGSVANGEAFETQHGPRNFLDEAMILFHDVVQVFTLNHGNGEGKSPAADSCSLMALMPAVFAPLLSITTLSGRPALPYGLDKKPRGSWLVALFG